MELGAAEGGLLQWMDAFRIHQVRDEMFAERGKFEALGAAEYSRLFGICTMSPGAPKTLVNLRHVWHPSWLYVLTPPPLPTRYLPRPTLPSAPPTGIRGLADARRVGAAAPAGVWAWRAGQV